MSDKIKAHILLSFVAIFYGLNYIIAKDVLNKEFITPAGFIMLRAVGGAIFFTIFHALFIREKLERKDFIYAALCSIFGVALNMLSFFHGLKMTSPSHASLIMVMTPIIVLVISALTIQEKLTAKKVLGIFFGLIGAVILIYSKQSTSSDEASLVGDLFVLLNASSYGVYLVLVRRLIMKYHPITVIKWVFVFGALFVIPFGGKDLLATEWVIFPDYIWISIAYVLICTTFLAYLFNVYALNLVMPSTVGFYIYFQPFTIAILVTSQILNIG